IALLFLEACGVPEHLIRKWGDAAKRANRSATVNARANDRAERMSSRNLMAPLWQVRVPAFILADVALSFLVGAAVSQIEFSKHIGAGNWWAFGVSIPILLSAPSLLTFFGAGLEWLDKLAKVLNRIIPLLCAIGLVPGWLKLGNPI